MISNKIPPLPHLLYINLVTVGSAELETMPLNPWSKFEETNNSFLNSYKKDRITMYSIQETYFYLFYGNTFRQRTLTCLNTSNKIEKHIFISCSLATCTLAAAVVH